MNHNQTKLKLFQRALRVLGRLAMGFVLLLLTLWASAASHFDVRISWLRTPLTIGFLLGIVAVWIGMKNRFTTNLPLAELKQRIHINAQTCAAGKAEDFFRQMRRGLPGIDL
jgi:hypothetical protein